MEGFLNPNEILRNIELREDMVAADFGCGSGGWVIPLAKRLEDGRVLAVDILDKPLAALKIKAQLANVSNIQTILADVEKTTEIVEESCDLVLMSNLFFQAEKKKDILIEGKRVLKKGGRILVVDWKKNASLGPKEGKVSPEELKELALDLNLRIEKEFEASPYHYAIILVK
ncbi:MAG TPA: class I SAM-dependent methyltransferase [Patescibacteria group bacterium]|nr:class I SAM-dependent methyltransferase [Patescibacteria group bacterium]